jgi:hypothetical protein
MNKIHCAVRFESWKKRNYFSFLKDIYCKFLVELYGHKYKIILMQAAQYFHIPAEKQY